MSASMVWTVTLTAAGRRWVSHWVGSPSAAAQAAVTQEGILDGLVGVASGGHRLAYRVLAGVVVPARSPK